MQPQTPVDLAAQYRALLERAATSTVRTIEAVDPVFSYDRPETHGVHVERVRVPLRDGSFLACDLHRPASSDGSPAPGRFPVIVYDFNAYNLLDVFGIGARYYVTRGYVAALCSVRGSGDSPGVLEPFGAQEQQDNVDLIEWLAAQPFSTGKVGQMGLSYGGHTSLLAAVNQPPHLSAIIPIQAFSDWYENTIYRGGIPNAEIREWQRSTAPDTLETYPQHPLYDDYWRERSVRQRWDRLTVPVLDVGGWLDRYRDGMVQNFQARPQNVWMVAGPWSHGMVPGQFEDIGTGVYLAWWDHWLSQMPAPLPKSKVTSYEMPGPGTGRGWTQFSNWPPVESHTASLTLAAGGVLADSTEEPTLARFTANSERLAFLSRPQERDVVIVGGIESTVRASFTAHDGNIAIVLEDVAQDGTTTRISNGWLKASHRDGNEAIAPVVPGVFYNLRVPLWPTHCRVVAGHSLRLTVSSDDYPLVDTDAPAGTVTLQLGTAATHIRYRTIS